MRNFLRTLSLQSSEPQSQPLSPPLLGEISARVADLEARLLSLARQWSDFLEDQDRREARERMRRVRSRDRQPAEESSPSAPLPDFLPPTQPVQGSPQVQPNRLSRSELRRRMMGG